MTLQPPKNANYAAQIVRIDELIELSNCDNVQAAPLLGCQAIVSKNVTVGTVGVVFTAETELSNEFAKANNLFRHSEFNQDPTQAGYLEDNRRVKAMKFRGHRSDALFLPLESLSPFRGDTILTVGDTFDELGGTPICRKYIPAGAKVDKDGNPLTGTEKKSRVSSQNFPQHFDTDNWFRNEWKIPDEAIVTVTQKLHGTSVRIGKVLVDRKLTRFERVKQWFGFKVEAQQYEYVFGSRTRTKDANNPDGGGYYDDDLWVLAGKQVQAGPGLPDGMILYGELIGWTPSGKAIQPGYTYGVPKGEFRLVVYRITQDGEDLPWDEVQIVCAKLGRHCVPEIWHGTKSSLADELEDMLDENLYAWCDWTEDEGDTPWPLTDKPFVDEGVCVRWDQPGKTPVVLKAKSPIFLYGESRALDKGQVDLETAEAVAV